MATKKKGLFSKIIEGPERSEDYARSTLPTSRWSLGWDLIKTNFGKLVKINLLMLLFLFPLFLLLVLRSLMISVEASNAPFSQNMGIGYPIYPVMSGLEESIYLRVDVSVFALLFFITFYLAVGISGGFYVMRNLVWTEGVFVASDFWAGVKKNYKNVLLSTIAYVLVVTLNFITIDVCNVQLFQGEVNEVFITISKIMCYIFLVFFTIVYLYSLTLGVTYKLKFFKLIKNSIICAVALIPTNLFFGAFALVGFLLLLVNPSSMFFSMGVICIIFISISLFTLIWTNYSQWVFDEYINDKVAGAKKNRGIYKKSVTTNDEENFVYSESKFVKRHIKPITDYDVEIDILQEGYTRKDLEKLRASKQAMIEDSDNYSSKPQDKTKDTKETIDSFMQEEDNSSSDSEE